MKLKLFIISVLMPLLFCSCEKADADLEESRSFEIDAQHLGVDMTQAGGRVKIRIETNLDWEKGFSVESDQEWCRVQKGSTHTRDIEIILSEYSGRDVRSAKVEVKSVVNNYTIEVRQLGSGPKILIKSDTKIISSDGATTSITITSNVEYKVTKSENSSWFTKVDTKSLTDVDEKWIAASNNLYKERDVTLTYASIDDDITSASCSFTQLKHNGEPGDIVVIEDIQYTPSSGLASEHQPGASIENTFYGAEGVYHSIWSQSADFPVSLEYFFEDKPDLDYLVYYPTGGNGNVGELDIFIATENTPEYTSIGTYNFYMASTPNKVQFNERKSKVTKVKFSIRSGGGNFVTCSQMQFVKSNGENALNTQLLTIFKDLSCSEVKVGVTTDDIYKLPSYFAQLAISIQNFSYDSYEKSFRIRDYEAYSVVEDWADILMTRRYSNLDNCTGIIANAGDELLVLVGDTHGKSITLQSISHADTHGSNYFLREGVNRIKIGNDGMLFLMYNTSLDGNPPPIRVHIPTDNGTVNGFFDLKEHKTDEKYAELLQKATHKYFFVRGERHMFYFHLNTLREVTPNNILNPIAHWDNMVSWQQSLMGIEDVVPSKFNNHMLAISTEDAYMWASDYRMGYIHTYLHNILSLEAVQSVEDNAWGPAHEMGHVHQYAINWGGFTEVSNNLFSNYAIYKLGKYGSRGASINQLNLSHNVFNNSFATIQHGEGVGELALRMNWQLWNYFHRLENMPDFWPKMFKEMRKQENRTPGNLPGRAQLTFAKSACRVANMDLTPFFEVWGFFTPVDQIIGDYGDYQYTVTQSMIDAAKAEIKSGNYAPMTAPFYYLEDRDNAASYGDVGHYSQFANGGSEITNEITYVVADSIVSVRNGSQAVAFEVNRGDDVVFFSNSFTFKVPKEIGLEGTEMYAVQANGRRVKMVKK